MSEIEQRIEQVDIWMGSLMRKPSRLDVRRALLEEHLGTPGGAQKSPSVRKAVMDSLDQGNKQSWSRKGIYVWFWRAGDAVDPWPLYVGKTEALKGMRGRHLDAHTKYAMTGTDMLCDPVSSRKHRQLYCFDAGSSSGISPAAEGKHEKDEKPARSSANERGECMIKQFQDMSILLLPMDDEELKFAREAEGILIAASEVLHRKFNDPAPEELTCMMNSSGKASVLGVGLSNLCGLKGVSSISEKLHQMMLSDS